MNEAVHGHDPDLGYNPRVQVPNFQEYLTRWAIEAERARAELRFRGELRYGTSAAETLDLFLPTKADEPRPVLLFVHGGYWRSLDKRDFSWLARPFVRAGVAVSIVNYGLAPATPLREIVAQCQRAVAFLVGEAAALSVNPERIVVAGHSAGGHIVAMLVATDWPALDPRLGRHVLHGAIAVSGLFDLEPLMPVPFLKVTLGAAVSPGDQVSPVRLRPLDPVRIQLFVGEQESSAFHTQAAILAAAWGPEATQGPLIIPARNHFSVCTAFSEPDGLLFGRIMAAFAAP